MFYHLIMHTGCNLSCTYCDRDDFASPDEELYDYTIPQTTNYTIEELKKQIKEEDYITFYGGEPLLALPKIKEIIDTVPCKGFMIQTNGILLNRIEKEYLEKFHTILVSIDGDAEATNKHRGRGVHERIIKNSVYIKENGFKGELIARMTITRDSSIYNQVQWLLKNGFDNIHWQLDAMFYKESTYDWYEKYNKEIKKLFKFWFENLKQGKVIRLYPFLVLTDSLRKKEKAKVRCGAGFANYTITTHGKIAPCPIMGSMKKYYCGELDSPIKEISVKSPCTECDILDKCGGRCIYVNLTQYGGKEAYNAVCSTIRFLLTTIEEKLPEIESLFKKGILKDEQFKYLKYNGVEVIP
ncbi:MAG: radical SAM additional 4Fe4S-binding protein [archaeon GW2011_AR17]|nr:MAG: radical SAM additional 4Fe4S-binding protein [archaeon GW2011_AR17]MBS3154720.1 TIGR04084 family radical SAM/SPASM domain-containing protein [Candidatus Woesearchaeota archaeon]HIH15751.1 TIGR04084 family radical SAM/SPASM domain-containing protein [Nanoarchaeota archaeon]HIH58437.1 TIGR04084 family radical SAM/SPASM domain-containing protein [Nanoarchaeota archaeon]HII13713.1 TIGR04084 family radical SAM/SPASM domain-containing protein [Nanoarchaeota archaeon]